MFEKFCKNIQQAHKQTTFSDAGFLGILRVKRDVLWVTLRQIPSSHVDRSKKMAAIQWRKCKLQKISQSVQGISIKSLQGCSVGDSVRFLQVGQKSCLPMDGTFLPYFD